MQPFNVMLARFPGNNQEHPASSNYIINLMEQLIHDTRIDRIASWYLADTPTPMVRNKAAKDALDGGFDYLLMIDSDMEPDVELGHIATAKPFWSTAWEFMMERRCVEDRVKKENEPYEMDSTFCPPATICAPYCAAAPREECVVFEWGNTESDSADANFQLKFVTREAAALKTGIHEQAALPTGLILYDTRVFRRLDPPWFAYEWHDKYQTSKKSTEDTYQSRNASLQGMPQFCAWDCWAGHHKSKLVRKPRPLTIASTRTLFADALARFRTHT